MGKVVLTVQIDCGEKTCRDCTKQNWDNLRDEGVRCELFNVYLDLCGEDDCYRCAICLTAEL